MAAQITNHKCPACTGPLHFVGASGKLECDYCGSSYDVAEIEALYAEDVAQAAQAHADAEEQAAEQAAESSEWDTSDMQQWGVEEGMKAYSCPSCGAELICDETTAATSCPYCGNPAVVPGQFDRGLKPNFILPFRLDQKAAEQALKNHYKGKKFLPKSFAAENKIKEVKGVYVPFWLFDGAAEADVAYDAENSRHYTSGDYEVTETDHFIVRRAGAVPFEKIPVDASTKMPDAHMDAIEPFDYTQLKPFSTAYLPGFLADKYDVSAEDSAPRADQRAERTALDAMRADVTGYGIVVPRKERVELHRSKVHYALLPVYTLGTTWKDQRYLFAMNGQTGKLIGDLPVDKGKYWTWFLSILAGVTGVLGTLIYLFTL